MKVSALLSTSGLGQNMAVEDSPTSIAAPFLANGLVSMLPESSLSSKSGDPLRELLLLFILTKSPCLTNFHAGILNGGGGGGGGIGMSGDSLPRFTLSYSTPMELVPMDVVVVSGSGNLRALIGLLGLVFEALTIDVCFRDGGGGCDGGCGCEIDFLVLPFFEENRLWKAEEGGGGGGGDGAREGGAVNSKEEEEEEEGTELIIMASKFSTLFCLCFFFFLLSDDIKNSLLTTPLFFSFFPLLFRSVSSYTEIGAGGGV